MSDNPEANAYTPHSDVTIKEMGEDFKRSPIRNYVAPPAPGYDVHGLWSCFGSQHRSGYATHAMALHWMLSKELGIPTQLTPHRTMDVDIERFPADREQVLFEWHKEAVGIPHALFVSFPLEVAAEMEEAAGAVVPYCAFEGDRVSKYARDLAEGPIFKKVWVVSDFVKRALLAAGVQPERVDVVRPMLTDGFWSMTDIDKLRTSRDRPVTAQDPFVFGTVGTWQKRKGMLDLVRAYFASFRREEHVELVIRTSSIASNVTIRRLKEQITEDLTAVAAEFGDHDFPHGQRQPRIRLELGTDLTDQQVIEWLGTLDCYVTPSYGEGLGIPQVWAKAQGVPMVASSFGAVGDMLEEIARANGGAVDEMFPHQLVPVDPEILRLGLMFERSTQWGGYKVADLGYCMRSAMETGRITDVAGAMYVREAFGKSALGSLRTALQKVIPGKMTEEWLKK